MSDRIKVKIGSSVNKKSNFDLSFDVTTTLPWGVMTPFFSKLMLPDSTITSKESSFLRFSAMPTPTFGRAFLKTYSQFVKVSDIYHPFGSFLAEKVYNGSNANYLPKNVPSVKLCTLAAFVAQFAKCTTYLIKGSRPSDNATSEYEVRGRVISNIVGSSYQTDVIGGAYLRTMLSSNFLADSLPVETYRVSGENAEGLVLPDSSDLKVVLDSVPSISTPLQLNSNDGFADWEELGSNEHLLLCFRFNRQGKRLYNVLRGVGLQLDFGVNNLVSFLPILAVYKAYFDLFQPVRNINWTETNCYKFIEYLESYGYWHLDSLSSVSGSVVTCFRDFLLTELPYMYYTESPDFVSAHQESLSNVSNSIDIQSAYIGVDNSAQFDPGVQQATTSTNGLISQIQLDLLQKLQKLVNKKSAVGQRIDNYLRFHYGSNYSNTDESNFICSNSTLCQISDVMSTADTDNAMLGEYAGKGIGSMSNGASKFSAKEHGYYISFVTVVPQSRYCQGVDPHLFDTTRYEFYTPEFDSLGYTITNPSCICIDDCPNISISRTTGGFGYIPRYFADKTKYLDLVAGDVALGSSSASLLPYTLSKILNRHSYHLTMGSAGLPTKLQVHANSPLVAGTMWRYPTKYPWISNYDRIFYNTSEPQPGYPEGRTGIYPNESPDMDFVNDNFILHMSNEVHYNAPMLPVSSSWDTDGMNSDSITIDKQ